MANTFVRGAKVWFLDSTGAVTTDKARITGIVVNNTTAGAISVEIRDPAQAIAIFQVQVPANSTLLDNTPREWSNGFSVQTLGGGNVQIQLT